MLKTVVVATGITALATVAVAGALRSERGSYRLQRATTIAAPPAKVHASIADLGRWTEWSPWERAGTRARRLTVISVEPEEIVVESRIEQPRPRTTVFELRLEPSGSGTRVTWTATCENDRAGSLEELLAAPAPESGEELERGLANLRSAVEKDLRLAAVAAR